MTNILIIGAGGQIARVATAEFLERTDAHLTLFLRRPTQVAGLPEDRVTVVAGDATDPDAVAAAVQGQDVVYANLAGRMADAARTIVAAMDAAGVRRLIFISSMGVDDEIPGQHVGPVLDPYREAARVVEASDLDYTLIRPAWLSDSREIAYGTTTKPQPFENADATVSRRSVADLIVRLVTEPGLGVRESLGVHHS